MIFEENRYFILQQDNMLRVFLPTRVPQYPKNYRPSSRPPDNTKRPPFGDLLCYWSGQWD